MRVCDLCGWEGVPLYYGYEWDCICARCIVARDLSGLTRWQTWPSNARPLREANVTKEQLENVMRAVPAEAEVVLAQEDTEVVRVRPISQVEVSHDAEGRPTVVTLL